MSIQPGRRPKYVIINDYDAPQPNMVCQWVPGVGYCYLDRSGSKPRHDGMDGDAATPIEAFGFVVEEHEDGTVGFCQFNDVPVTATYQDGEARRWQSRVTTFSWPTLKVGVVREEVGNAD